MNDKKDKEFKDKHGRPLTGPMLALAVFKQHTPPGEEGKMSGFEKFLIGQAMKGVYKESEAEEIENEIERTERKLASLKERLKRLKRS